MNNKKLITGLIFAGLFPSIMTLLYFVVLAGEGSNLQKITYTIGKVLQFTFPLWFLVWVMKTKIRPPLKWTKSIWVGLLFGITVGFLMMGMIHSSLFSETLLQTLKLNIQTKLETLNITSLWSYVGLGIFYSLIHSFLEEYYWRWFVYGQLKTLMGKMGANILSSLCFMSHHVIVLAVFFGWTNPFTYILSFMIALGGSFWAWHYERTQSLIGPWLSHMIEDAAIFYIGYQLVQLS